MHCIVIGSAQANARVSKILENKSSKGKHLFIEGNETTLPQGHLSLDTDIGKYNTVIYDTDSYTYSTMLNLLKNTPEHKLRLGTYSAKTKKLITEDAIYKNQ